MSPDLVFKLIDRQIKNIITVRDYLVIFTQAYMQGHRKNCIFSCIIVEELKDLCAKNVDSYDVTEKLEMRVALM